MLKLSETTSPNKLFDYDCVTLYLCLERDLQLYREEPSGAPGDLDHCQEQIKDKDDIREAAKKVLLLVDISTKRGGVKGLSTKEKGTFFFNFFFVAAEKYILLKTTCRNIDISALAYCV